MPAKPELYTIKPLKWKRHAIAHKTIYSESIIGDIFVCQNIPLSNGTVEHRWNCKVRGGNHFKSINLAKQAAERWYRSQIRKALRKGGGE